MATDGSYLPPITAQIVAQSEDFITKLQEVKAEGEKFDATVYQAQLDLDTARAIAGMEEARTEIDAIAAKPITMNVEVNIDKASLLASMAAIGVATKAASASGGGGGGAGGILAGGLLSKLLWGGGSGGILGVGALGGGLAGFGSIGALAGLGPEHLLTTLLGIGGSAAGGLLGGAALGAGVLTTAGVGIGTDMTGMGQAAGDIKNVVTAQNNLAQAIAVYGAGSRQATIAQAQLNYTLNSFSPIAQQAVLAASNTAQGFHQMFNAATGQAESTGAQIINQAMLVGEKFLPTIGQYAAKNMGIIQGQLQPLFSWLDTSGLSIFQQVEAHFSADLPTSMDAFDNGVELLVKTLGYLSSQTGGFMTKIDNFLKNANGPGFDKWIGDIDKLIVDFRLWDNIIFNLGRDIVDLFSHDAGTANSILTYLDQMLIKLGDWERSTSGAASIHNIFEVHKQEVMALLQLLPVLLGGFGQFYLAVAPAFTLAATGILNVIVPLLDAMEKAPFGSWILGLTLIAGKLGILKGLLSTLGITSALSGLSANIGGWLGWETAGAKLGASAVAVEEAGAVGIGEKIGASADATQAVGSVGIGAGMGLALGNILKVAGVGIAAVWATNFVASVVTDGKSANIFDPQAWANAVKGALGDHGGGTGATGYAGNQALNAGVGPGEANLPGSVASYLQKMQALLYPSSGSSQVLDDIRAGKTGAVDLGNTASILRDVPGGQQLANEYQALAQLVYDGKITTQAQLENFRGSWNTVLGATGLTGSAAESMAVSAYETSNTLAANTATTKSSLTSVGGNLNKYNLSSASWGTTAAWIASNLAHAQVTAGVLASSMATGAGITTNWAANLAPAINHTQAAINSGEESAQQAAANQATVDYWTGIMAIAAGKASPQWQALLNLVIGLISKIGPTLLNALKGIPVFGGVLSSALAALGFRAGGGPVVAGQTYLVGEGGGNPGEVLHMFTGGGGYVTPVSGVGASSRGGAGTVNLTIPIAVNVSGSATASTAVQIGSVVKQAVRQEVGQIVRQLNSGAYAVNPV